MDGCLIWDALTGRQTHTLRAPGEPLIRPQWSPDGKWLACEGPGVVHGWELDSGKTFVVPGNHRIRDTWSKNVSDPNPIPNPFVWSPDSRWIAAWGTDGIVNIWNVESRTQVRALRVSLPGGGRRLAWNVDGRLATAELNAIVLWDTSTGEEVFRLKTTKPLHAIAFSRDGRRLAAACEITNAHYMVSIWDARPGYEKPWRSGSPQDPAVNPTSKF